MSSLEIFGIVFAAYLAGGRTGAIMAGLLVKYTWWETLILTLLIDFCQLPFFHLMIKVWQRYMRLPQRLKTWLENKTQKIQKSILLKTERWKKMGRLKPLSVMAVSAIPIRGFGILSATVLATLSGYGWFRAILLVMAGSLVGTILTIALFLLPVGGGSLLTWIQHFINTLWAHFFSVQ